MNVRSLSVWHYFFATDSFQYRDPGKTGQKLQLPSPHQNPKDETPNVTDWDCVVGIPTWKMQIILNYSTKWDVLLQQMKCLMLRIIWNYLCRYGVASTYYGISLNITGFGLNLYLTHFIYAAIEVPAKLMVYCFLNVFGRRKCQAGTLLLTGICIAINIFLPKGHIEYFPAVI